MEDGGSWTGGVQYLRTEEARKKSFPHQGPPSPAATRTPPPLHLHSRFHIQTYLSTLKIETENSPENFVIFSHITQCHIPQDAAFLIKFNFTWYPGVWSGYIWFQFHMFAPPCKALSKVPRVYCIPSVEPSFYWCILNRCSSWKTSVCGSWSVRGYANNAGLCIPTQVTADCSIPLGLTVWWIDRAVGLQILDRGSNRATAEPSKCCLDNSARSCDWISNERHCLLLYDAVYSVESQPTFRRNISPPFSLLATCFHAGFLLNFFLRRWRWRRYVPPKRRLTFNGLHIVISHRCENLRSYMNVKYSSIILWLCLKTK
jgi:hypothetical protein